MTIQYREDTRSGADRRQADDRRFGDEPVSDDQRTGDNSRGATDRRVCVHDVVYKTGNTVQELEAWLVDNTQGQWNIALMDLTTSDLSSNIFRVMFELESDRDLFRNEKVG